MKNTIEQVSQKPLQRVRNKSDDQLQMENINLKLKQNEQEGRPVEDFDPDKHFENRKAYEEKPDKKTVEDIWGDVDDMDLNV